jgi:hypothetical protein
MGYATYLTFLLGYVSTLITVYYLAIKNVPDLLAIFPRFVPFAVLSTVIGVPLSVSIGWVHLKRSNLYSSEADIGVEANPWNYKLIPGYQKEVLYPALFAELRLLRQLCTKASLISEDELRELDSLEAKLKTLNHGGYVGTPRRTMSP